VEALKCGVEGPFFDAEQVVRRLLDALYECVAVQGFLLDSAEHHHLEGAGKQVAGFELRHLNRRSGDRGED